MLMAIGESIAKGRRTILENVDATIFSCRLRGGHNLVMFRKVFCLNAALYAVEFHSCKCFPVYSLHTRIKFVE